MPAEIVGVRVGVEYRQERRSRLAGARIGLRHTLAGGGQIPVVADGQINEAVQLVAAKSAVPVLGWPGPAHTRAMLERRRHVSRRPRRFPGDASASEHGAQASRREPFARCRAVTH